MTNVANASRVPAYVVMPCIVIAYLVVMAKIVIANVGTAYEDVAMMMMMILPITTLRGCYGQVRSTPQHHGGRAPAYAATE